MSIKTKFLMTAVALALVPLLIGSLIIGTSALRTATAVLDDTAKDKLTALRDIKRQQIEHFFGFIRSQVITLADDRMTFEAARKLQAAYAELDQPDAGQQATLAERSSVLRDYYRQIFGVEFNRLNNGDQLDTDSLFAQLSPAAVALQYSYIARNANPPGKKHLLDASGEETNYDKLHLDFHTHFRNYLERFGYYDLFLVDIEGHILYTAYKELDFATSLQQGPFAATSLGEAFRQAMTKRAGDVAISDFSPYLPSYNAAAAFIASPIFDGDKKLGVLIVQLPLGEINKIMTSDSQWSEQGMGRSGETYLVGPDLKARTKAL